MKRKTRKRHNPDFKAKVALEAVREQQSISEIARRYGIHPNQVHIWKRDLLENVLVVFESKSNSNDSSEREDELLKKIGELTVERDFLSRVLGR